MAVAERSYSEGRGRCCRIFVSCLRATHGLVLMRFYDRASYFLLRNGEFALSLIREIERLKVSRLTGRTGPNTMIREQDLRLALLRASLGTTAQHDPSLTRLSFQLPTGPLRPLLPSIHLDDNRYGGFMTLHSQATKTEQIHGSKRLRIFLLRTDLYLVLFNSSTRA